MRVKARMKEWRLVCGLRYDYFGDTGKIRLCMGSG